MVLPVVDAALVVVDGVAGVEVVTQRVWNYCDEVNLPRMIAVNRMDRERADASRAGIAHQSLRPRRHAAATSHRQRRAQADRRQDMDEMGGNGKGREGPIPAHMADAAKEAHENYGTRQQYDESRETT